jgi:hypothetical protein
MKTPRFQTAIPPTKYTNRRFSRLPELRRSVIPARETLRISARSGRKLCSVTRVPLGTVEREIHPVLLALLFDLLFQDAEDEHVPALTILVSGLAEDALLPEAIAP